MISLVEAKPGQGKTVYATYRIMEALEMKKRSLTVATNIDTNIPHSDRFFFVRDWDDILKLIYTHVNRSAMSKKREGSLLIVLDELSLLMNARNWDSLPMDVQYILRAHRHFGVDILGFSQSVKDIDVAYRRLVQKLYSVSRVGTLPFGKFPYGPWGMFVVLEYDSDDVEKDRSERSYLPLLWNPPELVCADPWVFRAMDSWEMLQIPDRTIRKVDHQQLICKQHGPQCPDLRTKIAHV